MILFFKNISFSQTIKNFDGDYKYGKAKYQYYNGKQNEVILNGKFTFSKSDKITERGEFKNNLRNGKWEYIFTEKNESVKITGKYKNDLKDGVWKFSVNKDGLKKDYVLNFKNDVLIGKININGLIGEFNGEGKYIGNWNTDYEGYSYTANFIDNILILLSRKRLTNGSFIGEYKPDTSKIDFLNLADENNHIIRQKYDLDGNVRTIVDDFEISKVYGVPDYDENLQEKLFYYFFDSIESRLEESFINNVDWTFLKQLKLINNPDFLYLIEKSREIQENKIKNKKKFEELYGPVIEYSHAEVKPFYIDGNDKFVEFLSENYKNEESVSGRLFLEFIIDKEGKLHIVKTVCSDNISCDEINRILNISPKWEPAKQNGKLTNVRISIPIMFKKMKK